MSSGEKSGLDIIMCEYIGDVESFGGGWGQSGGQVEQEKGRGPVADPRLLPH